MDNRKRSIQYCETCKVWRGSREKCEKCGNKTIKKKLPRSRGSYYFIPKVAEPMPRVTKIIDVLRKPGLEYWMKKTVAESALADPSQSVEEAMASIYAPRDKAGTKGSDVHKMIDRHCMGKGLSDSAWKNPYMQGYKKFRNTVALVAIESEKVVYSEKFGYAGTADLIAEMADGRKMLLDWKTSSGIYDNYFIQLSAYKNAYEEMTGEKLDGIAVVRFDENGNFEYREGEDIFPVFEACLTIYNWNNK